jgi:hypothetical protein
LFVAGGDGTYHFKVLVPSVAAGAIIGKGGETIAHLQKETGARVKMSKSHDFYPGVCRCVKVSYGGRGSWRVLIVGERRRDKGTLFPPIQISTATNSA